MDLDLKKLPEPEFPVHPKGDDSISIIRESAIDWWESLTFEDKFYHTIRWSKSKGLNSTLNHPHRVKDNDIIQMHKMEQEHSL